jgi:hypothetical protein
VGVVRGVGVFMRLSGHDNHHYFDDRFDPVDRLATQFGVCLPHIC